MAPRAVVIGYPIRHSRSPVIHNHWLSTADLPGSYERASVAPEDFADFVGSFASNGIVGANVTVPHKEAAFALAETVDDAARALGAVNTLWLRDGVLHGANTDVAGFLGNLDENAPGWDAGKGRSVVLGAGGAARAVIYGLQQRGFSQIILTNRTIDRAKALASHFGEPVEVLAWEHRAGALADADLVVNTTSLGMEGQPDLDIALDALPLQAVVTDLVYVPLTTPLLAAAAARGNRIVDGLGMLLHQAVPGFERWFGQRPVVTTTVRQLVIDDIARPAPS